MNTRLRPALAACVGMVLAAFSIGQAQDPRVRPPEVPFPDWRFVERDEEMEEYALTLPSAYLTRFEQNNSVPLAVFLPVERTTAAPVVVVLHYWGARDLRTERIMARELARKRIASVVVTLPYHLQRTPPGYSSGQLAIRPDPDHLIATMTQCVLDVRRTVDWIVSRPEFDSERIGITGVSLGALVAAYAFAVEPRISKAALLLGGADLAHILWNSSLVAGDREKLRRMGYTEEKLREKLAPIEPINALKERTSGSAFVVGAKYDTVIPRADTEKLIQALPNCEALWIDTGHYGGVFVQRRLSRLVADFFSKEFAGLNFEPPKGIYAPTVRVGALAGGEDGLQIGVGLDVWRAGNKGSLFGAVLVTPTQPALFAGYRFDERFAPGVFASSKRVSLGLFWSVVL